jgi:hypothetical protein
MVGGRIACFFAGANLFALRTKEFFRLLVGQTCRFAQIFPPVSATILVTPP